MTVRGAVGPVWGNLSCVSIKTKTKEEKNIEEKVSVNMSGAEGEAYGKKMKEEEVAAESGGRADAERKMERKVSWSKLRQVDSLNLEAGRVSMVAQNSYKMGWRTTLYLAFQSIGVVYGDIGTSPLYVFSSVFTNGIIKHEDDILGVLSLIIYTITLLPFLKYVFIVLWANDNGNGGAFALYSLICRHMKMSLIPNEQPEDRELSNYKLETPSTQVKWVHKLKQKLEASLVSRVGLLFLAIMGTSMVIGDGILTPSISVLSAVSGISKSLGQVANNPDVRRVPGIGLMYSELGARHSSHILTPHRLFRVSGVASEERFLFRQVEPREYRVFRCVVRHGYNDVLGDPVEFELQLIQSPKAYVQEHNYSTGGGGASASSTSIRSMGGSAANSSTRRGTQFHRRALEKGVVYMLGDAEVVAHPNSSIFNKIVVNYVYSFFRKNFRQGQNFMAIPRKRLLKVGMTYEI
ncbi:hypothetical protein ACSQ67_019920 [Phaseolus vulgaris]